ncbi:MAG: phosphopyruvate hydratase [Patescibacteria group bacterium]|jgi:enolase
MSAIRAVRARTILDSRAGYTLEVDVLLDDGTLGRAAVPSGASAGSHEAVKLSDTTRSVANVKTVGALLVGHDPAQQEAIDRILLDADGTANKGELGANVLLALSLASCDAAAQSAKTPLYAHIHALSGGTVAPALPTPMFNVINGGNHADNALEFQEFMIVPARDERPFHEKMRLGVALFQELRRVLQAMGHSTAVGDEGGFAPRLNSNEEAIELLVRSFEESRFRANDDVTIALDVAASAIPDLAPVIYPHDVYSYYAKLVDTYPISLIEDPLTEDDWQGWTKLTAALGSRISIVGDDLFTTNPARIKQGIEVKAANGLVVKPDQIGTLTETLQAVRLARQAGMSIVISHRSGETESTLIADLAVGIGAEYIKAGAPARGERVAKYNQLLRIEELMREQA